MRWRESGGQGVSHRCVVGGERGRVCKMKFLSWNVRGLGGVKKRIEVRLLVGEKMLFILCL